MLHTLLRNNNCLWAMVVFSHMFQIYVMARIDAWYLFPCVGRYYSIFRVSDHESYLSSYMNNSFVPSLFHEDSFWFQREWAFFEIFGFGEAYILYIEGFCIYFFYNVLPIKCLILSCLLRLPFSVALYSHCLHSYLIPSWILCWCFL